MNKRFIRLGILYLKKKKQNYLGIKIKLLKYYIIN